MDNETMTTNAERQAAYKKRMRKAGYQQITLWIQPARKPTLAAFAFALREMDDPESLKSMAWDSLVNWSQE